MQHLFPNKITPSPVKDKGSINMPLRGGAASCHGMVLRRSTRPQAARWTSLPTEIRLMILEAIANQENPGWASLASVSQEWQSIIAKSDLNPLKLRVSCLDDFGRSISSRESIRLIVLDIELLKYTCRCCKWYESERWTSRNNRIISDGIWRLFYYLSTWTPGHGLTLELNAYSPSDSKNWFKRYYFSSDDEGNEDPRDEDAPSSQSVDPAWLDPRHG